jgi:DNA-binding transcriptional regulator YiaG
MPAASLADDIALTAKVLVGMARNPGASLVHMRQANQVDIGQLAKAVGTSPEVIRSWEAGLASPAPHECLRWLATLYEMAEWRARAAGGPSSE